MHQYTVLADHSATIAMITEQPSNLANHPVIIALSGLTMMAERSAKYDDG
jgi:hypothetical protein